MPKQLDPKLTTILKEHDEDPNVACWDCHGTWVVYHKALERIADRAGIVFDEPKLLQNEMVDGRTHCALLVTGHLDDRVAWSIGEAAPNNNKNAYPYAMAEKRAKDRVILKLIGLSGDVYSEEEADEFKDARPKPQQREGDGYQGPPGDKTKIQNQVRAYWRDVLDCEDNDSLIALRAMQESKDTERLCAEALPDWWNGTTDKAGLAEVITNKSTELKQKEAI